MKTLIVICLAALIVGAPAKTRKIKLADPVQLSTTIDSLLPAVQRLEAAANKLGRSLN